MENSKSPRGTIWFLIQVALRAIFFAVLFISVFILSLWASQGKAGGKLAVAVTIVFSWLLYYIVDRKFKFKSRGIWLTYAIVGLIITTGISYRLLPVSSTGAIRQYSDLKGVQTAYWQLKTGSHIAYYKMYADGGVAKKKYPILFLHGGPGAYVRQLDIDFFKKFTQQGYDVYLYDQVGAGRSGLLPVPQYSHKRNFRDAQAILDVIGADKYIMVAQSYGCSLLADLASDRISSLRIEKAVYCEPGVIVESSLPEDKMVLAKSPHVSAEGLTIPLKILVSLAFRDNESFISQNEVINYAAEHPDLVQALFSQAYPLKYSARVPKVDISTFNISSNTAVKRDVLTFRSKKQLADSFRFLPVPSVLLLGESSYIERSAPLDLLEINPNIQQVQYLKGVGHLLWNRLDDNNEKVYKIISAFLNGQPPLLQNYPKRYDVQKFLAERR